MDDDFRAIQSVRRLIRAKRYHEAYQLLKETNHPQVPALEAQLKPLIYPKDKPRIEQKRPSNRVIKFGLGGAAIGLSTMLLNSVFLNPIINVLFCGFSGLMVFIFTVATLTSPESKAEYHTIADLIETRQKHYTRRWYW